MTPAPRCPRSDNHPVIWAQAFATIPAAWWCCTCRAYLPDDLLGSR